MKNLDAIDLGRRSASAQTSDVRFADDCNDSLAAPDGGRSKRAFPFPKAQRTSILVVEDDPEIRDAVTSLLEDEGFGTLEAADGVEALKVLSKAQPRPGLILLDLMMPKMNGWEFRNATLADAELRTIPVVVLSALGTSLAERDLMRLAAVLPKPVTAEALLEAIQKYFRRFN